ncbi:hypothetical protein TNCV_1555701 [Trichonephila clavipes]|nr:hypothetical protein TNCV_1555701 [Trichonephila clavipes]
MSSGRVVQKIVKKTSSNYRISIGRAEEHVRETSPAVLMAEATIPVTTPYQGRRKGNGRFGVVYVKVKGEQEMVNAVIDTGAQMPVKTLQMIRNPAKLREPSKKKEGIISSTDSKSVCSQEVVTDLLPETQSLLNVPKRRFGCSKN